MQEFSTAAYFLVTLSVSQKGLYTANFRKAACITLWGATYSSLRLALHSSLWKAVYSTLRGAAHSAQSPSGEMHVASLEKPSLEKLCAATANLLEGLHALPLRGVACNPFRGDVDSMQSP